MQPLVTYAQNREDLYLWALVGHRTPGRYVDVGCNHEHRDSVTKMFYARGWSGLNIDANPDFAAEYAHRTRDRFLATGVGDTVGTLSFHRHTTHGHSSFVHTAGADDEIVQTPVDTLDRILATQGIDAVDFLKIDVEGFEAAVLRGLDFDRVRPTVILVEGYRPADCEQVLLPHDYRLEFFDGLNTYYVDTRGEPVTILKYAERVLEAGYLTDREQHLLARLEQQGEHAVGSGGADTSPTAPAAPPASSAPPPLPSWLELGSTAGAKARATAGRLRRRAQSWRHGR